MIMLSPPLPTHPSRAARLRTPVSRYCPDRIEAEEVKA